ncbi:hypothetical protein ACTHQF_02625 [Pedobacter sp. SAFR-022]|jgi:hypothetical protein|uniref:hypothetical protein n=1 Tax=Pedobacter sp. SAFR-022 TaxID=3436861 RepID=UPI003F80B2DB
MKKALLLILLVFSLTAVNIPVSTAQCAMCSINADQGIENGNTQTKGINAGVLSLLAAPFLLMGGIGILWYRKYKEPRTSNPL